MDFGFSVKEAVEKRYSCRTYDNKPLSAELKNKLLSYAKALQNPYGPKIRVQLIEKESAANAQKLGTYGVINGASTYLGVTVVDAPMALEAIGYDFERLVLYATSMGLGTCWLGGTFNRSAFTEAMEIREGELFPILSPIGFPATRKSLAEKIMRSAVKAGSRQPWKKLFYKDDFNTPLSQEKSGEYSFTLEMLRLAPSAVNGQPWRVVLEEDKVHFYKKHSATSELSGLDMQRIDMGIAMCHFDMAAKEQGMHGSFVMEEPDIKAPSDLHYTASWIRE